MPQTPVYFLGQHAPPDSYRGRITERSEVIQSAVGSYGGTQGLVVRLVKKTKEAPACVGFS